MGLAAVCIPSLMHCCDPRLINHMAGGVGGGGGAWRERGGQPTQGFAHGLRFRFTEVRPIISGWN